MKNHAKALICYARRLQAAIDRAEATARGEGEDCVGTHHLLLALFDERETVSRDILVNLGVSRETLVAEIDRLVSTPGGER